MREQDKRAVEGMAICGIDLEGLIKAFPNFPSKEVEEIYDKVNKTSSTDNEGVHISRNCS